MQPGDEVYLACVAVGIVLAVAVLLLIRLTNPRR